MAYFQQSSDSSEHNIVLHRMGNGSMMVLDLGKTLVILVGHRDLCAGVRHIERDASRRTRHAACLLRLSEG